jgi:hypothetical protein
VGPEEIDSGCGTGLSLAPDTGLLDVD